MRINVLVAISITQELTFLFGTEIIVEREARAVGQPAARSIQSELAQELTLHAARTLGAGRTVARRGGYLIIHTLGIEIVALLHHLVHDLIHGVEARAHRKGALRTAFHLRRVGLEHDACILSMKRSINPSFRAKTKGESTGLSSSQHQPSPRRSVSFIERSA